MADEPIDDAPHAPSDVHLLRARERGQVCRSYVLAQAIQVCALLALVQFGLVPLGAAIAETTRETWLSSQGADSVAAAGLWRSFLLRVGPPLAGWILGIFAIAWLSHALQIGWIWRRGGRSAPGNNNSGWTYFRLFRIERLLPITVAALIVISLAGYGIWSGAHWTTRSADSWFSTPRDSSANWWIGFLQSTLWPLAGILLFWGGCDYAWRRYQFLSGLKLTDRQVREEQREDSSPAKSRIRSLRDPSTRSGRTQATTGWAEMPKSPGG